MVNHKVMDKGLGQLEAYVGAPEGVAFKMDNGMFWCKVEGGMFGIQAVDRKVFACRFFVTITKPGIVALRDCRGWYLAPKLLDESCPIYPLQPMHRKLQPSLEFKVFHKDNKVAFQSHDGRFLTKFFRGVYIVEAYKNGVVSSCFFRPEIGTILTPDFTVLDVILGDLSNLRCRPSVLRKDTFVNETERPLSHIFAMTWAEEGVQITAWARKWGLGLATIVEFTIKGMKASIKYNEDNDQVVVEPQPIFENIVEKVELPPRTKATARLLVRKQNNFAVPFVAKIEKQSPGGAVETLFEPGVWKGHVYHDLNLEVKIEPLRTPCAIM